MDDKWKRKRKNNGRKHNNNNNEKGRQRKSVNTASKVFDEIYCADGNIFNMKITQSIK